METLTLNVIKKNRVYFKCLNDKGYEVKLKITPESSNLSLGKQDLLVNDISVRTKYGTDIIYTMVDKVDPEKIVTLKHDRYNKRLVDACHKLAGKWDSEAKAWVFPDIVENEVEELDVLFNDDIVTYEITALGDCYNCKLPVYFFGYLIAKATGRDSGAQVCDDVSMIKGSCCSGGSMKNWVTEIAEGSIFRLKGSRNLLEKYGEIEKQKENFSFKII